MSTQRHEKEIIDSSIYLGTKLGACKELVPLLKRLYGSPEHRNPGFIEYTEFLNTRIPSELYLDVNIDDYQEAGEGPQYHLNMLSDYPVSLEELRALTDPDSLALSQFRNVLEQLGLERKDPELYSHAFIYKVGQHHFG